MNQEPNPTSIRSFIPRGVQIAFVGGLVLGILLGWAFSGVVSAVLRFGVVTVLLLIFAAALYFWWRVRRIPKTESTVVTWSSLGTSQDLNDLFGGSVQQPYDPDEIVIDFDDSERKRNS
ncbi:MAG: hypothetical protein KC435_03045 [Thermomicrobiales bacterium]|nr:hypothetical protein [Thermomicrobiales bacterium]